MTSPFLNIATGLLRGRQNRRADDLEADRYEQQRADKLAAQQAEQQRYETERTERAKELEYSRARQMQQDDERTQDRMRGAYESGYMPVDQVHEQGRQIEQAVPLSPLPDFTGVTHALRAGAQFAQKAPTVYSVGGTPLAKGRMSETERIQQQTREDNQAQAAAMRESQAAQAREVETMRQQGQNERAQESNNMRAMAMALAAGNRPKLRPIPAGTVDNMAQTRATLSTIDDALNTINTGKAEGHIGARRRFMPNWVSQITDPDGANIRGQIAGIGAVIRHELSGAAITPSEAKFLEPDIPSDSDGPDIAKGKLARLRKKLEQIDADKRLQYSEEYGYHNALPAPNTGPAPATRGAAPSGSARYPSSQRVSTGGRPPRAEDY